MVENFRIQWGGEWSHDSTDLHTIWAVDCDKQVVQILRRWQDIGLPQTCHKNNANCPKNLIFLHKEFIQAPDEVEDADALDLMNQESSPLSDARCHLQVLPILCQMKIFAPHIFWTVIDDLDYARSIPLLELNSSVA